MDRLFVGMNQLTMEKTKLSLFLNLPTTMVEKLNAIAEYECLSLTAYVSNLLARASRNPEYDCLNVEPENVEAKVEQVAEPVAVPLPVEPVPVATVETKAKRGCRKQIEYDFSMVRPEFMAIAQKWVQYKKDKGSPYKSQESLMAMVNKLYKYSNNSVELAIQIIDEAMGNNYQGFFPIRENNTDQKKQRRRRITGQSNFDEIEDVKNQELDIGIPQMQEIKEGELSNIFDGIL